MPLWASMFRPGREAVAGIVLVTAIPLLGWYFHLRASCLPSSWNVILVLAIGGQIVAASLRRPGPSSAVWCEALACGVLIYLMSWSVLFYYRRGLQAIANVAFLLALALFAQPIFLVSAVFLSLVLMRSCRDRFPGSMERTLLIATPAALCLLFSTVLRALAIMVMKVPALQLSFRQILMWRFQGSNALLLEALVPSLIFAVGVLISRLIDGRGDTSDLIYGSLLLALVAALLLFPNAGPRFRLESAMVARAGSMCLVGSYPPQSGVSRVVLVISAIAPCIAY